MVSLSVAIMASPPRATRAAALAAELELDAPSSLDGRALAAVVSMDVKMQCARHGASLAWGLADARASHHLVIQDDAEPCVGFLGAALRAIAARPHDPISFFPSAQYRLGDVVGPSWARPRSFIGAQALAMPFAMALEAAEHLASDPCSHDDYALDRFFRARGLRLHVTVPGLVQHARSVPSLMGHANPLVAVPTTHDARELRWDHAPVHVGA